MKMLKINKIRIEITTEKGLCGFDADFKQGLNLLVSNENTCGKSSVLAAIYYCLGLEEILGGRNEKALPSVYKSQIEIDGETFPVLQSGAYLEIANGSEIVTLFRSAKMNGRDSRMITIYFDSYDKIFDCNIKHKDTYVNMPNAAQNDAGFHRFMEEFMHLKLPTVRASDNSQRKLYLQLIFSCMFIEQKHGWSDVLSGMPILGIKEAKKKVIEYVLKLDTLANEKRKEQLKIDKKNIEDDWKQCYSELRLKTKECFGQIINFPDKPCVLKPEQIDSISIVVENEDIGKRKIRLEGKLENLQRVKPKVIDDFDQLQEELLKTEDEIQKISLFISECKRELYAVQYRIKTISKDIEIITIDLSNNKDAARLQKLGSELKLEIADNICPVCHQPIQDSLLPGINESPIMSVDENIRHLEAQLKMMKFALENHKRKERELKAESEKKQSKLTTLLQLAKAIRSDLYSVNDDLKESVIYKRIEIELEIKKLLALQYDLQLSKYHLMELTKRWSKYLANIEKLPAKGKTTNDYKKIKLLRNNYIKNLERYGYKSVPNLDLITISEESYLPLYEGFDMRFDSSASDGIRTIWAFTMALLQVSLELKGNHPRILLFDEPDQQSTMVTDMKEFFDSIIELGDNGQVLIAITLKDSDTKDVITGLQDSKRQLITIDNKAFQLL